MDGWVELRPDYQAARSRPRALASEDGYNGPNDQKRVEAIRMASMLSVAEAKTRFSELVNRASYGRERFLIRRRGKPVGAIVSVEDLAKLEAGETQGRRGGALATVGALAFRPGSRTDGGELAVVSAIAYAAEPRH
jgi:prevent-host-death family protein